jgi:signal transduction histidine kinase/FixJ family two-component response regulator
MKTNLLAVLLLCVFYTYAQTERDVIYKIDSLNSSAKSYLKDEKIIESFKLFNNAKKLSDSIDDCYGIAVSNYNLGKIYMFMEDIDHAEKSFHVTLGESKKIAENNLTAKAYLNIAKIKKEKNLVAESILNLEKGLKYIAKCKKTESNKKEKCNATLLDIRITLSELYLNSNNLDKALINLLMIEELISNKTDVASNYYQGYSNYLFGIYYNKKGLFNTAITKFDSAIFKLENSEYPDSYTINFIMSKVHKELSNSLSEIDKKEEAYAELLTHNTFKDKLLNLTKQNNEDITRSKLLLEEYKNKAQVAKAEQLHQELEAKNIKTINVVVILTAILLTICLISVYMGLVSKRKLTNVLRKQNKELESARLHAVKSSELKSKFISNVSHELRTPLYGVVGLTSLLLEKNSLNATDKKHVKSLKYSGDYLLNLVNDILQVGKMEANKIELKKVPVNIKDLLDNIVNSFNYRLVESNNKIEVFIDNKVPEYIVCDKIRLSQILINLIGNSVKFTTNGTINLSANLLSLKDNEVGLRFIVEDDGIGIPQDKLDTIFDKFVQVEDTNLSYQGTGLGLSITKNLVKLFDSEIQLESKVNVGTKVSFDVDFEIDKTKGSINDDDNASPAAISKIKEGGYKILIAEDNKINQVVTKSLLKKYNYECTIVENGEEAVNEIKNNHYDLILMDINMPIMNGNDATKVIRQFDAITPIIALTAADIDEIKEDCIAIGFNDIIIKPFDNYEFHQTISQNIQNAKLLKDKVQEDDTYNDEVTLTIAS